MYLLLRLLLHLSAQRCNEATRTPQSSRPPTSSAPAGAPNSYKLLPKCNSRRGAVIPEGGPVALPFWKAKRVALPIRPVQTPPALPHHPSLKRSPAGGGSGPFETKFAPNTRRWSLAAGPLPSGRRRSTGRRLCPSPHFPSLRGSPPFPDRIAQRLPPIHNPGKKMGGLPMAEELLRANCASLRNRFVLGLPPVNSKLLLLPVTKHLRSSQPSPPEEIPGRALIALMRAASHFPGLPAIPLLSFLRLGSSLIPASLSLVLSTWLFLDWQKNGCRAARRRQRPLHEEQK